MEPQTDLLDRDSKIKKLIHLSERNEPIPPREEIFNWGVQDCLLVICENNRKYLIGRLGEDYEFCPDDWDFLTPHLEPTEDFKSKAHEAPEHYAGLEVKGKPRMYQGFTWLDLDSGLWWHFLPFKIETNRDFVLKPEMKKSAVTTTSFRIGINIR